MHAERADASQGPTDLLAFGDRTFGDLDLKWSAGMLRPVSTAQSVSRNRHKSRCSAATLTETYPGSRPTAPVTGAVVRDEDQGEIGVPPTTPLTP